MCELFHVAPTLATFRMPFQDHDVLWKIIGYTGIGVFFTRFLFQWLYSEKHKESKIPPMFWWQSLIGTILCLAYFTRQREWVGVSGYIFNVIPYSRNLVLVYRKKREAAMQPAEQFEVAGAGQPRQ